MTAETGRASSVAVRKATLADASSLAMLAAETFPLACPPGVSSEAIEIFLAAHLSERRFVDYLADRDRELFIATVDGEPAGYAMLVFGRPKDPNVIAALTVGPTVELSKLYVRAHQHGSGTAGLLVRASVEAARFTGARGVWLGVNQQNGRANSFYEKQGFRRVGTKTFLVGGRLEDDFVRELLLDVG